MFYFAEFCVLFITLNGNFVSTDLEMPFVALYMIGDVSVPYFRSEGVLVLQWL